MTYEGRGAHGGTPAFYLSEIFFFGDPVTVPEPGTVVLMLLGLAGFAFVRWTRRGQCVSVASAGQWAT